MAGSREGSDYNLRARDIAVGAQMLFVAFRRPGAGAAFDRASIPTWPFFAPACGTLFYQVLTKVFASRSSLGSSFAFIAPIMFCVKTYGVPATMGGLAAVGSVYGLVAALVIRLRGVGRADARILPTIVTGPVIMVIGLILAPVGVFMAMGKHRRRGQGRSVSPRTWP